ncbi:hypothetical protein GGI05_003462 [Coemansia sp. RSA 2603]|nr:hypothetical protein GGI05_003462 [Coemansia sp. RSA 2603]
MPSTAPPTLPTDPTAITTDIAQSLDKVAQALHHTATRIRTHPQTLFPALALLLTTSSSSSGKLVFAGVGKSYLIGRKLAATMMSTGTYAVGLHATDALHGDLGMVRPGDCLVALSYSGASDEVLALARSARAKGVSVVGMGRDAASPLGRLCDAWIECGVEEEMSPEVAAPTCSSAVMMAVGDAVAMMMMHQRCFGQAEFAKNHPAGELGKTSRDLVKQYEPQEL